MIYIYANLLRSCKSKTEMPRFYNSLFYVFVYGNFMSLKSTRFGSINRGFLLWLWFCRRCG